MKKNYYVYLMTNKHNSVIYTGMTGNINRRITEHKMKLINGFSKKYNITKLVCYESFEYVNDAILREKQIEKWPRRKKIQLVNTVNKDWRDLAENELF